MLRVVADIRAHLTAVKDMAEVSCATTLLRYRLGMSLWPYVRIREEPCMKYRVVRGEQSSK